jgi:hypothetical protein
MPEAEAVAVAPALAAASPELAAAFQELTRAGDKGSSLGRGRLLDQGEVER